MGIRDVSNLPDEQVPEWVRKRREERRYERALLCSCNLHFSCRREVLEHCRNSGHSPLVRLSIQQPEFWGRVFMISCLRNVT